MIDMSSSLPSLLAFRLKSWLRFVNGIALLTLRLSWSSLSCLILDNLFLIFYCEKLFSIGMVRNGENWQLKLRLMEVAEE